MPVLIFVPGLLCTATLFEAQIKSLSPRIPCHVADTTGLSSVEEIAARTLAEINGPFIAVGLSMGGYIATEMARSAPERALGLGLLSTNASADSDEKRAQRRDLIALSQIGKFKGVTPRLLPRLLSKEAQDNDMLVQQVLDMALEIGQENFTSQQMAIMARQDRHAFLETLLLPSLVLCGTADILTPPAQSQKMADALPASELVLLDDIGHLSTMEAPEACNEALHRLLDRVGI